MTEQAERFAQESLNSQKQLANSEQKREEFQIQTQETNKQLTNFFFIDLKELILFRWKARLNKFEKDIERYKLDLTQTLEKNQQLIKEIDDLKSQNLFLKEQVTKFESDLNDANVESFAKILFINRTL